MSSRAPARSSRAVPTPTALRSSRYCSKATPARPIPETSSCSRRHAFFGDLTITDFHGSPDGTFTAGQDAMIVHFVDVGDEGRGRAVMPDFGDGVLQAGDPGVTQVGADMVIDWQIVLGAPGG